MSITETNGLRILEVENKEKNVFVTINGDEVAIIGKKLYLGISANPDEYVEMDEQEALSKAKAFELKVLYDFLTEEEKHDFSLLTKEQQKSYIHLPLPDQKLEYVNSILFEKLTEEEKEIIRTLTVEQGNLYIRLQTSEDRASYHASLQPVEEIGSSEEN
jgi:hypothetical protein